MKLLLIADEESPRLYEHYRPGCLNGIDLILSAGDLKAHYLEFLVTLANKPLVYVHGNHDGIYEASPPEGCLCADGKLLTVNGQRILGLGGSRQYSGGPFQYTEAQMRRRIRRLKPAIWKSGGVDILLTHTPPAGCGDLPDPAHCGFEAFLPLLEKVQPRYWVHGHIHTRYRPREGRILQYGKTTIINASGEYVLEL